ncbi:hypothetical protein GCM10027578_00670 [Spirosoma luteolum]
MVSGVTLLASDTMTTVVQAIDAGLILSVQRFAEPGHTIPEKHPIFSDAVSQTGSGGSFRGPLGNFSRFYATNLSDSSTTVH